MKGFPLFPHSFPPLKGKTLWKAGPIEAPSIPKIAVFHRHTADAQRLSRTSGQDAPTAGTQCLSRLRRGPRQQTATIVSSAPRGKALQKQMGSLIAHPQGALHKGQAHSVFRAYGGGHGSKRQRLHPPLHRGKPYRNRWDVFCPIHRGRSAKADGKVIRLQVPSLRHKQARSGRTASFAPTAGAAAANRSDCILRSTGESPTEADGKSPTHREYSAKAGGKVCKMGNPFPAA